MPQQIIYPQVPKCSYLTFKRFRVDYSDDVGHSITNFTRLVYLSIHNLFLSIFLLTSQKNKETPTTSFLELFAMHEENFDSQV